MAAQPSTPSRTAETSAQGPVPGIAHQLVLRPVWALQALLRLGPRRALALIVTGFLAAWATYAPHGSTSDWSTASTLLGDGSSLGAVLLAGAPLSPRTASWVASVPRLFRDRRVLSVVLFFGLGVAWAAFARWSLSVLLIGWAAGLPLLVAAVSLHDRLPKQWGTRAVTLPLAFLALFAVLDCMLRALWFIGDQDHLPSTLLLAFSGAVVVGVTAQLQIWESSDPPEQENAEFPRVDDLRAMEAEWLALRRAKAELPRAPAEGDPRPANLVGLALSGGGIRSATVSFGFLQGLADAREEDRKPLLELVDYLSTVSGGGWAGGALTARLACDNPPLDPTSEKDWSRFARTFRSQGDYLVRGGLGFTTGTLRPFVILVVGLLMTTVTVSTLAASGVLLLNYYSCADTRATQWLASMADTFADAKNYEAALAPLATRLFFGGARACHEPVSLDPSTLGHHLYLLNWLGVAFLVAAAGVVLGALGIALGAVVYLGPVRTAGSWIAAGALKAALTLLVVIGLLQGWWWVPAVGSALFLLLLLAISQRFTRIQLSAIATFLLGAHAALFKYAWPTLDAIARAIQMRLAAALLTPVTAGWRPSTMLLYAGYFGLGGVVLGFLISRNHTGLQWFWTERIRNAYLKTGKEAPADWPLAALRPTTSLKRQDKRAAWSDPTPWNIGGPSHGAPLHIINAAINTPGSTDDILRKRGTARLELSPYAVGGPAIGWTSTARYGSSITLAHALSVSAAAVNSEGGQLVPRWARVLLVLLNCGLGQWFRNPTLAYNRALTPEETKDVRFRRWGHFWTGYVAREVFARNSEKDTLVFLSDGGHHDNLGLGALVDRGCRLIVCVDAAADPDFAFTDLARVAEVLHVDAGWTVSLGLADARPKDPKGTAEERRVRSSILTGTIHRGKNETIALVYVKASVETDAPFGVLRYAESHPAFPQQSTANQFFDESQFEAYRKLGEYLAQRTHAVLKDQHPELLEALSRPRPGALAEPVEPRRAPLAPERPEAEPREESFDGTATT